MMNFIKHPKEILVQFSRWISDLDRRLLLLILLPISLFLYVFLSSINTTTTSVIVSFSNYAPFKSIFNSYSPGISHDHDAQNETQPEPKKGPRIAVCLVGGARRFELTGPSIIKRILKVYNNSDLFLHSPLDSNTYKFTLLKKAPRIAGVKIFQPQLIPETESQLRVLSSQNSPNGIQGLLQYFNLVEGCLTMIQSYQEKNNFTYDWIIRTRVDGYWSKPLAPDNFIPGHYLVPPGSSYGGLNDRFGVGDVNSSIVALSRLSMVPELDSAGYNQLNSETAFKAQLTTRKVPYVTKPLPFCIVTDRRYDFPPARFGVPVAALSSPGPLSGAKCRPCTPVCTGSCVGPIMSRLDKGWSWTEWTNNTVQLCDAHDKWENGWEKIFDRVAGKKLAAAREEVWSMKIEQCVNDFEKLRNRTASWEAPPVAEICRLGLKSR
ncbi:uncharacterized protein LOC111409340 [Olea europaea var. sylvestris]|uniref:Uncharacterized protein LOC111409340 n=1 Tax=Olea europaea subsp. europaea TaxID=158383 RepID=A0A8S0QAT7_OLEEU|nr:uncharacterized protein LOC111409340 [Olea europaea var. sylvestris]CAA2963556.1 uncharacterized protein LOC111409340 [Olea europaea subsp. europaea]